MTRILRMLIVGLAIAAASCSGDDTPISPDPTPAPTVTDKFEGQINRNGAATHNFTATLNGTVSATLTTLAPDSALVVGLSLGTWNGTACAIVVANDRATQGTVVNATLNSLGGSLCVRIYDVGNITENVTYEINVVHP